MSVRSGRAAIALAPVPVSAAEARTFVRTRLDALAVPDPPLENAVLLTSELVTNALLHAKTRLEVRLRTDRHRVRVEVHDRDNQDPRPSTPAPDATNGRGLLLVQHVADEWGTDRAPGGKMVWFEMVIDGSES